MPLDHLKRLAQTAQHAESQKIDLEDFQFLQIVLVPFDDSAFLHRRILDRHDLIEPVAGDDKAADVLGEMAGKAA